MTYIYLCYNFNINEASDFRSQFFKKEINWNTKKKFSVCKM